MKNALTKLQILFFAVLISAGFLLRTLHLETVPRGLQSDEASFLINTTALLQTGKDEDGKAFPLYLNSLIDSKPALYSYLQLPFVAVLGPTTQASRLPSAILGMISIGLFYLLLLRVFEQPRIALLGATFLNFSPWHIMNSRSTQEVILSFTLILASLLFAHTLFYKSYTKKHILLFFITTLLAMYVYHSAKVVLLLFYLGLVVFAFTRHAFSSVAGLNSKLLPQQKKSLVLILGSALLSFVLTMSSALTRFSAIGLLGDDLPKALIFEYTTKSTGITPLYAIRAFYNKPFLYFTYFLENYLAHFDLNFLFTSGGATRRFSVPHHGLFYIFELLLLPLGIFALIKSYSRKLVPWFFLLLLAVVPAALTTEEIPSSIRSFTMLIPLTIATTLGFDFLLTSISGVSKKMVFPVLIMSAFVLIWSVGFFVQQFFVMMPIQNTLYRSRSYEVVSELLAEKQSEYDRVYVVSDLREMYIYLWQQDLIALSDIQAQPKARYQERYSLDKYTFLQQQCDPGEIAVNSLIVAPYGCAQQLNMKYSEVGIAHFDDHTPGFILFTNK